MKKPNGSASKDAGALLTRIRTRIDALRPSETKVARVVLAKPAAVIQMTLAELATVADVSEPTILRFAAAVGCDGFHQFRIELAQSVALGVPATHSVITPGDNVETVVSKAFDYSITSLDHTRRHLDCELVQQAVDALSNARNILFIGLGASGIVALDAEQKFPLFGKPCSAPVDHHQQFLAASVSDKDTAVVGISNIGRTRSVIDAVSVAKTRGAKTIAVTGSHSELSELVDIPLIVESLDNTDVYTPTISRLAQLVVIDVLATSVMLRRPDSALALLSETKQGLTRMRMGQIG